MRYNTIIIDSLNLFYRVTASLNKDSLKFINNKRVYTTYVANFIKYVEDLDRFLEEDGEIIFVYDVMPSRQSSTYKKQDSGELYTKANYYSNYKFERRLTREENAFYGSMDLIRHYFDNNEKKYKSVSMERIEADDLVKPLILNSNKNYLLLSNDSDWVQYSKPNVFIGDSLDLNEIKTSEMLSEKYGFKVNEYSVPLFKAIFGDKSDSIPFILTKTKSNLEEFKNHLKNYDNLMSFKEAIYSSTQNVFLKSLMSKKQDFERNLKLTLPIHIEENTIKNRTYEGKNNKLVCFNIKRVVEYDALFGTSFLESKE